MFMSLSGGGRGVSAANQRQQKQREQQTKPVGLYFVLHETLQTQQTSSGPPYGCRC